LESFLYGENPPQVVYGNSSSVGIPITDPGVPRAFGDYQYYVSLGGDQYFNLPASVDAIFGASGVYPQMCHVLSQPSFESAGYTAMGEKLLLMGHH